MSSRRTKNPRYQTTDSSSKKKIHFKTKSTPGNPENKVSPEKNQPIRKFSNYKKAYSEFEKIKAKKNEDKQEAIRRKIEIKKSLEKYKQNKREKFKKLAAKTKKGQPIMKNRIEMMLEKIQSFK